MKFKNMFSPIQIGPMTVKNRFVVPPMGNNFANSDGTWSDESVAYYGERAKGQFGLITIEATVVHKGAKGGPKKPCLYDDNSIESLKKITDACHEEGAKVSIQLQNAGPEGNAKNAGAPIQAATAIASADGRDIPEEVSTEKVYELVKGYGEAAERAMKNMKERTEKEIELRDYLINRLTTEIPYSRLNGDRVKRLPNNVNVSLQFIEGESMLLMLDQNGICGSSGSACTSGSLDPSHVLLAIGLPHEIAHGSLRLTLSEETTKEDLDFTVDKLKEIVQYLRSMSPLYEDFMKNQK